MEFSEQELSTCLTSALPDKGAKNFTSLVRS